MSAAQEITRHYGGDWHGSYGCFPAPGHSKDDRGVTVKDAPGGDVLINSFNGADWREIKDECRRVGLLPEREPRANRDDGPRETGWYEYADASGAVVYRTVRVEQVGRKKRFKAQRPDGRGGWLNGLASIERVPYRLPDILAADYGEPIYLVEGERKADKLASWGFVATAVAFGCKGWRECYAAALAGRHVIILPDNDDEGRDFAQRAAKDIEGQNGTAQILDLPGLPPKGDIMDWTGIADDLRALVAMQASPAATDTFPLADLALWSNVEPTPKPFVMPGFVPARELTLATGAGGANKSTFGQQLATCVAAGVPMLGLDVMAGKALYITAEDDDGRLHWMQAHICRALGVSMADLAGRLHLASLRGRLGNELATFDHEGKLRPAQSFHVLKATIEATGADLVVLDNAAHLFAGNENDRQQVTAFVNLLYSLCRDLGVTIILVAHANKAGDSYSGSTAWLNAVRSQIVLSRPEGGIDPDERILSLGKANYARQGEEIRCRWHDFALVRDSDLPDDMRAQIAEAAATAGANAAFLECLRARVAQGDGREVGPSPGPNYGPAQFEGMPQAKGFNKEALKRAMDRLYSLGRIKSETIRDRKANRDKTIIVEVAGDVHNGAQRPAHPLHNTSAHDRTSTAQHTTTHTLYTTYREGAAHEAAAPSPEMDDGLDANGDIIGWNDKPHGGNL